MQGATTKAAGPSYCRRWPSAALGLGTAFLLIVVVGSGIMAASWPAALLCNTLPTGAIIAVLILIFGPLSGAHFNPAVGLAFALRGELLRPTYLHRHASRRQSGRGVGIDRRSMHSVSKTASIKKAPVNHASRGHARRATGGHGRQALASLRTTAR